MSVNRMVEYHMHRLNHKRADIRKDAIHQLVLLNAIEALEALQDVYHNDPDPEVREEARTAGRELFLKHKK